MTTIQQRDLHGLKALVTGATSGLGRAIAFQLARDGADVTVHGRDAARGVQTVEEIQLQGGAPTSSRPTSTMQRASPVSPRRLATSTFWSTTPGSRCGDPRRPLSSRLRRDVRRQRQGAVLPRLGVGARHGGTWDWEHHQHQQHGRPPRSRRRRGLRGHQSRRGFIDSGWAAEYSPRGVRVNAVAPGPMYTRPEARERFDSLGATTAMKRAADPAEIAEVVAFLASPRASYMTGAIVAADGGRTAI